MKPRALISVSDKTGIIELAHGLVAAGYEILSTGGTKTTLEQAGIQVTGVSEVTGFPECLDGRVKTLHPALHAGILARRDHPEHMAQLNKLGIQPVDIVVINLYPFRETVTRPGVTLEEAIENIDIGGPSLLRGSAKNWLDVCVITDPSDYPVLLDALKAGGASEKQKFLWAQKVFEHTAQYDCMIARFLGDRAGITYPDTLTLTYTKVQDLRYGENPHQTAAFYTEALPEPGALSGARQLHGKELSYNNIADTSAAISLLREFTDSPCAVAVKHANPCGVGCGADITEAWLRAYEADPVAVYGGIVALNSPVDLSCAEQLTKTFLEVIIAPAFLPEAFEVLSHKKNIRLMEMPEINCSGDRYDLKKVAGGLLVQSPDHADENSLSVATRRSPTEAELKALKFAWRVVKHTRSNAVVLTNDITTIGIGVGQVSRIGALELAVKLGGDKVAGSVMASDAYFPFGDCVELAAKSGVTAVIQPGGSIHDQESIDACDRLGIAMVFTGVRHFRH